MRGGMHDGFDVKSLARTGEGEFVEWRALQPEFVKAAGFVEPEAELVANLHIIQRPGFLAAAEQQRQVSRWEPKLGEQLA